MKHDEVKNALLSDPEAKKEYDDLELEYTIKSAIIRLRAEKGLSQEELANLIGTKQSAIARLENGQYNPSVRFLNRIAKATDKELIISFKPKKVSRTGKELQIKKKVSRKPTSKRQKGIS